MRPALPSYADAWDEVLTQIRRVGSWGAPSWSHPVIAQAVAGMGGWTQMCSMELSETATWRAQFRDVYNAYASRAEAEAKLLPGSRAVAQAAGALKEPRQDVPQIAAPAPSVQPVDANAPLRFAQRIKEYRADERQKREDANRQKAADWLKENAL